ncbi:MAG: tetratricopeptide repeat protein [Thermoanaerobaculia bacterium]
MSRTDRARLLPTAQGDLAAARELLTNTSPRQRAVLGDDHPDTRTTREVWLRSRRRLRATPGSGQVERCLARSRSSARRSDRPSTSASRVLRGACTSPCRRPDAPGPRDGRSDPGPSRSRCRSWGRDRRGRTCC